MNRRRCSRRGVLSGRGAHLSFSQPNGPLKCFLIHKPKAAQLENLTRLLAKVADQAAAIDPLHTSVVANFNILDKATPRHHDSSTLVATHKGKFGRERPVAFQGVKVSVADTGVFDIDEDLIWAWLLDRDLLVLDWTAGLLDDLGPLLLGNGWGHV